MKTLSCSHTMTKGDDVDVWWNSDGLHWISLMPSWSKILFLVVNYYRSGRASSARPIPSAPLSPPREEVQNDIMAAAFSADLKDVCSLPDRIECDRMQRKSFFRPVSDRKAWIRTKNMWEAVQQCFRNNNDNTFPPITSVKPLVK